MFKKSSNGKFCLHFVSFMYYPTFHYSFFDSKHHSDEKRNNAEKEMFLKRDKKETAKRDLQELFLSGKFRAIYGDKKECFLSAVAKIELESERFIKMFESIKSHGEIENDSFLKENSLFSVATFEMTAEEFIAAVTGYSINFDCITVVQDYKFNESRFVEFDRWWQDEIKKIMLRT